MDNVKLKELVLKELQKEAPREIAQDEKKAREFILRTINEPLVDKMIAEFCEMNPQDTEVLNVFKLSDEELERIKAIIAENIDAASANSMIEKFKYEQAINSAGLAYKVAVFDEYIDNLNISEL
jgi:hypothetical protein